MSLLFGSYLQGDTSKMGQTLVWICAFFHIVSCLFSCLFWFPLMVSQFSKFSSIFLSVHTVLVLAKRFMDHKLWWLEKWLEGPSLSALFSLKRYPSNSATECTLELISRDDLQTKCRLYKNAATGLCACCIFFMQDLTFNNCLTHCLP